MGLSLRSASRPPLREAAKARGGNRALHSSREAGAATCQRHDSTVSKYFIRGRTRVSEAVINVPVGPIIDLPSRDHLSAQVAAPQYWRPRGPRVRHLCARDACTHTCQSCHFKSARDRIQTPLASRLSGRDLGEGDGAMTHSANFAKCTVLAAPACPRPDSKWT